MGNEAKIPYDNIGGPSLSLDLECLSQPYRLYLVSHPASRPCTYAEQLGGYRVFTPRDQERTVRNLSAHNDLQLLGYPSNHRDP